MRRVALWLKCNGNTWEVHAGVRLNYNQLGQLLQCNLVKKGAGLEKIWDDYIHSRKIRPVKIITWLMILSVLFQTHSMLFFQSISIDRVLAYSIQETFPTCTSTPRYYGGVLTHLQTTDTYIHKVQQVPQLVYTDL